VERAAWLLSMITEFLNAPMAVGIKVIFNDPVPQPQSAAG